MIDIELEKQKLEAYVRLQRANEPQSTLLERLEEIEKGLIELEKKVGL